MTNIASEIEDDKLAKTLKSEGGIGTPATRSSIIANIINSGFVLKEKEKLVPSEKALLIYKNTKDLVIGSPVISAIMEDYLQKILKGDLTFDKYITWLKGVNEKSYNQLKSLDLNLNAKKVICVSKVPKMEGNVTEDRFYYIVNTDKGVLKLAKEQKLLKIKITKAEAINLFTKGVTKNQYKFKSKSGKEFSCNLEIGDLYQNTYINLKYKF